MTELSNIRNYDEKLAVAKMLGFNSLEKALISLYSEYPSTIILGDCFDTSYSNIGLFLRKLGIELQKKGGRKKVSNLPNQIILDTLKERNPMQTASILDIPLVIVGQTMMGKRKDSNKTTKIEFKRCEADYCDNIFRVTKYRRKLCDYCFKINSDYRYEACGY